MAKVYQHLAQIGELGPNLAKFWPMYIVKLLSPSQDKHRCHAGISARAIGLPSFWARAARREWTSVPSPTSLQLFLLGGRAGSRSSVTATLSWTLSCSRSLARSCRAVGRSSSGQSVHPASVSSRVAGSPRWAGSQRGYCSGCASPALSSGCVRTQAGCAGGQGGCRVRDLESLKEHSWELKIGRAR